MSTVTPINPDAASGMHEDENREKSMEISAEVIVSDDTQLPVLSDRQMLFVNAYLSNGCNAKQAAIAAGYTPEHACNAGYRLTMRDEVRAHIDAYMRSISMSAAECLAELTTLARAPSTHFQQILQGEYTDENGRKHPAVIRQDLNPKVNALKTIAQIHGMLSQQVDINIRETKTIIGIDISKV